MKTRPSAVSDAQEVASLDSEETPTKQSVATKLERRRRIEDLDEERRLREELSEF